MQELNKNENIHSYYKVAYGHVLDVKFFDVLKEGQKDLHNQIKDHTAISILRLFSTYKN